MKTFSKELSRILSVLITALCLVVAVSACNDGDDDNLYNNGGGEIVDTGDNENENPSEGEGNEDEGGGGRNSSKSLSTTR